MSAAEDRSWEYTLGRIDERTENIEKRLDRVETDLTGIKEKMLTKTTFLAVLGIVVALLATLITLK